MYRTLTCIPFFLLAAAAPVLAGSATAPASKPSEAQVKAADKTDDVQEVIVTGSLIRNLPKEYMASPRFSYSQDNISESGAGAVSEFILTIPQNFTGDLSEFATTGAGIGSPLGDATTYNQYDGFAGFALRGLASDATLTLLNGHRMPSVGMNESPTVSVIPSMLIKRIDIIPDGASATYGADAVAGVVNIVTRKPTHGLEVQVHAATTPQTGKADAQVGLLGGHAWNSGSLYGMAMYQSRSPYMADPVQVDGEDFQATQLPHEQLSGVYGGIQQNAGDLNFSMDASYFKRDRDSQQNYIDYPTYNRVFRTITTGGSLFSGVHWKGHDYDEIDLTVDYSRTDTNSSSSRMTGKPSRRVSRNTLFVAELRGQTAIASLPAGEVIAAGGLQYRRETLRTDATIFFNKNGGEREVNSVFGELSVPLVAPQQNVPGIQALNLSLAARYEDLGFDSTISPKIGLRLQVNPTIAWRATYAKSFLAPRFRSTMGIAEQDSFGIYKYPFLDPSDQAPSLPAGHALVLYRAGANPDLKVQNADTVTFGFDLTPASVPNLVLRAGYYRIKITDRIGTPTPNDSLSLNGLQTFNIVNPTAQQVRDVLNNPAVFRRFAELPSINNGDLTFFNSAADVPTDLISQVQLIADIRPQNFAVESTDGFDFDASYRTPIFGGTAMVNLTGQYILNLELTAGGTQAVSRLDGYAKPSHLRVNGTLAWGRSGYSMGTFINYVDGYTDDRPGQPTAGIDSYTTASVFLNLDMSRLSSSKMWHDTAVQFVVSNLFDRQPSMVNDSVLGYDPYNNPPNPRTVGVTFTKRFD